MYNNPKVPEMKMNSLPKREPVPVPNQMYPNNAPKFVIANGEFEGELLSADPQKGVIYIRINKKDFNPLSAFLPWLSAFYNEALRKSDRSKYELKKIVENQILAVNIRSDVFIRGIVMKVNESTRRITFRDADKGSILTVPSDWAFNIDEIFLNFSFQAIPCVLQGLQFWVLTDVVCRIFKKLELKSHPVKGQLSKIIRPQQDINGVATLSSLVSLKDGCDINDLFFTNVPLVMEISVKHGVTKKGVVSRANSRGTIWIRFEDDKLLHEHVQRAEQVFQSLDRSFQTQYGFHSFQACKQAYQRDPQMMCFATFGVENKVYRVLIIKLLRKDEMVKVERIDYGTTEYVSYLNVFKLPDALKELDYIAALVKLKGIKKLSEVAINDVLKKDAGMQFKFSREKDVLYVIIRAVPSKELPFLRKSTDLNEFIIQNYCPQSSQSSSEVLSKSVVIHSNYTEETETDDTSDDSDDEVNMDLLFPETEALSVPVDFETFPDPEGELNFNRNVKIGHHWEFKITYVSPRGWVMMDDHVNASLYLEMYSRMQSYYNKRVKKFRGLVTIDNIINEGYYVIHLNGIFYRVKTMFRHRYKRPSASAVQIVILELGAVMSLPISYFFPMHNCLKDIPAQVYTGEINLQFSDVDTQVAFMEVHKNKPMTVKVLDLGCRCGSSALRPHMTFEIIDKDGVMDFTDKKHPNNLFGFGQD